MSNDRGWWEERIRTRLEREDTVSLDDLAEQEMGVPEGLLEAVEHMKQEDEITVRNEDGERLISME